MEPAFSGASNPGCILRAFWLFAGPALLIVLAVPLARHSREAVAIHLLYFATLAASVTARLLDAAAGSEQPSSPTAAPPPGKRAYLMGLMGGGVALWAAAWWLGPEFFP
jgi:hypothetical protein